jgi:hypothetical protein
VRLPDGCSFETARNYLYREYPVGTCITTRWVPPQHKKERRR